jgi:hypothetical protein
MSSERHVDCCSSLGRAQSALSPTRESIVVNPLRSGALWIVVGLAVAAGAAVAFNPLFLAVELVVLLLVAAWSYPQSVWPFVPLAAIVISPSLFMVDGEPFPNGDAIQKLVLLVALLGLIAAFGLRYSRIGAAIVAVVALAALVSLLGIGGQIDVDSGLALRAAVGYCLPWLFFFVDWRNVSLSRTLGFLIKLPLLCFVAGAVLQVVGVSGSGDRQPFPGIFRVDEGVLRLQGASIPSHLAMLALIGLASALCLLALSDSRRDRGTYAWVVINLAVLVGTATRGAVVVGIALILTFGMSALLTNRSMSMRGRRAILPVAGIAFAALAVAAPELVRRSIGNRYEGTFNTSGRAQAWDFFMGLATESPFTGKGLGFASIAVERFAPPRVQAVFLAPHNEYIHLLLDGGVFFAVGLILMMMAAFAAAARAQTGPVRYLIGAFGVGTLFYSYVDNTFSTPQFTVVLVIFLGALASHPRSGGTSTNRSDTDVEMAAADAVTPVPAIRE